MTNFIHHTLHIFFSLKPFFFVSDFQHIESLLSSIRWGLCILSLSAIVGENSSSQVFEWLVGSFHFLLILTTLLLLNPQIYYLKKKKKMISQQFIGAGGGGRNTTSQFSPPRRSIQAPMQQNQQNSSRGGVNPVQTTVIINNSNNNPSPFRQQQQQHRDTIVRYPDYSAASRPQQQFRQFSPSSRTSAVALLRNNHTLIGTTTNRNKHFSPPSTSSSSSSLFLSTMNPSVAAVEHQLESEIRVLEEEIVKAKLRGEWANRRIVAIESLHNAQSQNPKATLFRYERRKIRSELAALIDREEYNDGFPSSSSSSSPGRATGLLPSSQDLHVDVASRLEKLEQAARRINDQLQEVTALRDTQERSHREKVTNLRRRRDMIRERKIVIESQIRIAEGEIRDDNELSDKQYKRYCDRIEQSRQESLKRYETSLSVQTERCNLRCSMIQKETDEIVHSMRKLLEEKRKELDGVSAKEQNSYVTAASLGGRVEEVENAGDEINKLQKKHAVLEIEETHTKQEIDRINEEITKSHFWIYELDGKIQIAESTDSQKMRLQETKLESMRMSIRSLQERIAVASKRRPPPPPTTQVATSNNNNVRSSTTFSSYPSSSSASSSSSLSLSARAPSQNRSLIMLDSKLDELNQLNHVSRLQIHDKEHELARLSDAYNDVNERIREAAAEGEFLFARLAKLRHDAAVEEARKDVRSRGVVGGTSLTGALAAGSLFQTLAGGR